MCFIYCQCMRMKRATAGCFLCQHNRTRAYIDTVPQQHNPDASMRCADAPIGRIKLRHASRDLCAAAGRQAVVYKGHACTIALSAMQCADRAADLPIHARRIQSAMFSASVLSYLHHRAVDLADADACATIAEYLVTENTSASSSSLTSSHPTVDLVLPFHKDTVIPPPPLFLLGPLPNHLKAFEFWLRAVELGKSESAVRAAHSLQSIKESEREINKSRKATIDQDDDDDDDERKSRWSQYDKIVDEMLSIACQNGDVEAIHYLATKSWRESIIQTNPSDDVNADDFKNKRCKMAQQLWMKAAHLGDIRAMTHLAESFKYLADEYAHICPDIYDEQEDSEDDSDKKSPIEKYIYWLEKAYESGEVSVLPTLASIYRQKVFESVSHDATKRKGKQDLQHDDWQYLVDKSLSFTEKAASEGDLASLISLALAHATSLESEGMTGAWSYMDVERDDMIAIHYLLQAYDLGQESVLNIIIGILYRLWQIWSKQQSKIVERLTIATLSSSTNQIRRFKKSVFESILIEWACQFNIQSHHIGLILSRMKEVLQDNGISFKFPLNESIVDIFKIFMRLDDMDMMTSFSTESTDLSSGEESA